MSLASTSLRASPRLLSSLAPTTSRLAPLLARTYAKKKPEEQPDPVTSHIAGTVDSTYGGGVKSGGGAFGKKQAAQEDQWAYQHDKELFERLAKKLKAEVAYQPDSPVVASGDAAPAAPAPEHSAGSSSPILSGGAGAASGSLGRKQAAQEGQYIYEHDKELLSKLKKP